MKTNTREEIENKVCDLLMEFGPDGHIDGFEEITDYILALLEKEKKEAYEEGLEKAHKALCDCRSRDCGIG